MAGRLRLPRQYEIPVFASVEDALAADLKLDAASVAVPTVHHHAVASPAAGGGVDCLVEKPLAATLAEADELIALAEKHGRILQPGIWRDSILRCWRLSRS
jgi:predicted dehydrogenase